jgi:hypothetical protein
MCGGLHVNVVDVVNLLWGILTRTNQEIEQYLHLLVDYQQANWPEWLAIAKFSYNNKFQVSHPSMLTMGTIHKWEPRWQVKVQSVHDFLQQLKDVQREVEVALYKACDDMTQWVDWSCVHAPNYKPGILYGSVPKTCKPNNHLGNWWRNFGPYPITDIINPNVVKLKLPPIFEIWPKINITRIPPYKPPTIVSPTLPTYDNTTPHCWQPLPLPHTYILVAYILAIYIHQLDTYSTARHILTGQTHTHQLDTYSPPEHILTSHTYTHQLDTYSPAGHTLTDHIFTGWPYAHQSHTQQPHTNWPCTYWPHTTPIGPYSCWSYTIDAMPSYYVTMPNVAFPNQALCSMQPFTYTIDLFTHTSLIFYSLTFVPTSV